MRTQRLTTDQPQPHLPPPTFWQDATPIADGRRGHLQELDERGLGERTQVFDQVAGTARRLCFSRSPDRVDETAGGRGRCSRQLHYCAWTAANQFVRSARFAVRQLVEVAVRALSPGINDPLTAITVIDRPGAALCEITSLHLPCGVWMNEGSSRTGRSTFNDQLLDSMLI